MNQTVAATRINTALSNLTEALGEPIFDEWALVEKNTGEWKLMEYSGNRREEFLVEFNNDIASLRETLDPTTSQIGDFAFSHEGYGSGFDAHICAGDHIFVLFNNTAKSTGEITSNPKWTAAQIYFSELVEAFIADPIS